MARGCCCWTPRKVLLKKSKCSLSKFDASTGDIVRATCQRRYVRMASASLVFHILPSALKNAGSVTLNVVSPPCPSAAR